MSEIKIGDRVSYKYESAGDIGRVIEVFPGGEYVSVSFAPDDFLICEPVSDFRAASEDDE